MSSWVNSLSSILENQGWLAFPLCFLGGIISSTSPCVLAMIPLAIGFVGGYAEGSPKKAIQYSFVFTAGLTVTFTVLGIVAGLMGRLFGDVGSFWKYVLPVVAILIGLQLLEVFKFNVGISQRLLPQKKALLGALLTGLFFGILATPCATPVLAAILTFAASKKSVVYSGGLLLSYAVGHWALVLGAGISAGFTQKVIESKFIGNFNAYSKKIAGVILIGVGVYFLAQAF